MAEINIVRKRPVWPWIVGLVAFLALIVITVMTTRDRVEDPVRAERPIEPAGQVEERVAPTTGVAAAPLREYFEFAGIVDDGDPPPMGPEHEYAAEGMRRLAAALEQLTAERPDVVAAADTIDDIRERADQIRRDPASTEHARHVREAFLSSVDIITTAPEHRDDGELRRLAESVSPERPLLEQRESVREFFHRSAEAIRQAASRG